MQQPPTQAIRASNSPAFAAFHASRLDELRGRMTHLCKQAWDVNAAWLLQHDVRCLATTVLEHGPQDRAEAWFSLGDALAQCLQERLLPDVERRSALLAQFRQIDINSAAPERRMPEVQRRGNERVETPPLAFWRRWVDDAPDPELPAEPLVKPARPAPEADFFDLSNIDIDAVIAGGRIQNVGTEIHQVPVATHLAATAPPPPAEPADDFLPSGSATPADGFDWGLDAAAPADDFWEVTTPDREPAPAAPRPEPAAEARPATPAGPPTPATVAAPQETVPAIEPAIRPAPVAPDPEPVLAEARPAAPASPSVRPIPATASLAADAAPGIEPAPAPAPVAATPEPAPAPAPEQPAPPPLPEPPAAPAPRAEPGAEPAPQLLSGSGWRIYHLTESDDLACELDQRLEQLGYELELLDSAEELTEVLGALTPHLVLVDAPFLTALEAIGSVLQTARLRSSEPIRLLVLCAEDTMQARLLARRAGADELLFAPRDSDTVIARIEVLLHAPAAEPSRILIVEDDPAQGLFAASILRNAGMQAEVIEDGLQVMEAMHRIQPDLVLMDLYMPNCDGSELTALIREQDAFVHTPIVFLSGESDEDKHFLALSAGGDDFLSKPIRPKHLIAAVRNRIQRAQAIRAHAAQLAAPAAFDHGTGLHFRAAMLERLEQALVEADGSERNGGLLFIGIHQLPTIRRTLGLTTTEELLEDVAQFIVNQLGDSAMACRYGDGRFLVLDASSSAAQLQEDAQRLQEILSEYPFDTPKGNIRLGVGVGMADLRAPFADALAVLSAAEQAAGPMEPTPPPAPAPAPAAPPTPPAPGDVADKATTSPPAAEGAIPTEPASPIARLLAGAIEENRLALEFQPIVAMQGGEQAQYQSLMRLRTPEGGVVHAAELLPELRRMERLPEFDRWVMAQALEVAATRLAMVRPVTLFVNQGVETLCEEGYPAWLIERIAAPNGLAESIVIEVDMRELGLQLAAVQKLATRLASQGVRLCLSHYQASASQNAILQVLSVKLIKVDPNVLGALGNQEHRKRFKELVERLHAADISVIAPRVEHTHTAAALWMSGIDYIQGNLVQLAGESLDFDFNAAVLG